VLVGFASHPHGSKEQTAAHSVFFSLVARSRASLLGALFSGGGSPKTDLPEEEE